MPLGYEVTIFEQYDKPGGLMRTNIPAFRLPDEVLDDETSVILDMGVDIRYNTPGRRACARCSTRATTPSSSASARRAARNSTFPAATTRPSRTSTSASTGSSRSPSATSTPIGERVLIIGVGNTAMDCCRSSRRLGGNDIKVMARRPRGFFKASPWELDDAEEEGVEIVVNHAPKRFVIEDGRLVGMEFDVLEWDERRDATRPCSTRSFIPCDDVILAIGQENAFPWIERDLGMEFGEWDMPVVDEATMQSTLPGRLLRRRRGLGPEEHHLGRRPRPPGGDLDPQPLPGHRR